VTDAQPRFALRHSSFPGRAGELQARGSWDELAAELGSDYATYHHDLAERLETLGGQPDPRAFQGDYAAYARACNETLGLVIAEQALRDSRRAQLKAAPNAGWADEQGLVDERHRLVSVEPGDHRRVVRRGSQRAQSWDPPQSPMFP
jgi:hypothetical protein